MRVADEKRVVEEGKCIIFDDSFEHEVWNHDTVRARIVLIFDVWHPDLSDEEVRFLDLSQKAKMKAERKFLEAQQSTDDFYSIIEKAKSLPVDEAAIWS